MKWYIYVLKCVDNTLYTGITNDLLVRLNVHNAAKGAKYTKSRLPVELVWSEEIDSKSAALKREYELKQLTRAEKLKFISGK